MLRITLVKSLIGNVPRNRATVHALGLRKIGQSAIQEDSSVIRGMIHHVKHLLRVEQIDDQVKVRKRVIRGEAKEVAAVKTKPAAPKAETKPVSDKPKVAAKPASKPTTKKPATAKKKES
jgi:large subunit ribosomal protein L30